MERVFSYYAASAHAAPDRPPLRGDVRADVCIVGAGIAGCSAAIDLAARGYRVVLLEGERVGWGASGRSGGQAIFGFGIAQSALADVAGAAMARRLWDVSIDALALIRDRVARYSIDCDLSWGHLHAAIKPRQREELLQLQRELERDYEYRSLEFLERPQVESLLATRRYCAALRDSNSGHLHPLNYTLGLAAAAECEGATIYDQTCVRRIEHGAEVRVHTDAGVVRASHVLLTRGAYLEGLSAPTDARIMPVATYIVATAPLGAARASALIRDNLAVADTNFVLDYFRLSADHRLLFGGRVSYSGVDVADTSRATRTRMLKVFPQLATVPVEYTWTGRVDITMNRAPDFGRLAPNVYYLQGFSGHGIAMAGMAGHIAAEAIAGQAERFDLFAALRHREFPGGRWMRMPALVLGMLWYRLQDLR